MADIQVLQVLHFGHVLEHRARYFCSPQIKELDILPLFQMRYTHIPDVFRVMQIKGSHILQWSQFFQSLVGDLGICQVDFGQFP